MFLSRLNKLARAVVTPVYWRFLLRGVMPTVEHSAALSRFSFRTVFDIGANRGQFTAFACRHWPNSIVHCFEPIPNVETELRRLMGSLSNVMVHREALGNRTGEAELHLASRNDSSSLLPTSPTQTAIFGTQEIGVVRVPIARLDSLVSAVDIDRPALLKIDVQGFELDVLRGSEAILPVIDAVYVEVSYMELYQGQPRATEIVELLLALGFELAGSFNQQGTSGLGAVQADLLFTRNPAASVE